MKRDRKTKIVATLGPATSDTDVIEELFHAGVDMFRLNFSHGAKEGHAACAHAIRELENTMGRPTSNGLRAIWVSAPFMSEAKGRTSCATAVLRPGLCQRHWIVLPLARLAIDLRL